MGLRVGNTHTHQALDRASSGVLEDHWFLLSSQLECDKKSSFNAFSSLSAIFLSQCNLSLSVQPFPLSATFLSQCNLPLLVQPSPLSTTYISDILHIWGFFWQHITFSQHAIMRLDSFLGTLMLLDTLCCNTEQGSPGPIRELRCSAAFCLWGIAYTSCLDTSSTSRLILGCDHHAWYTLLSMLPLQEEAWQTWCLRGRKAKKPEVRLCDCCQLAGNRIYELSLSYKSARSWVWSWYLIRFA